MASSEITLVWSLSSWTSYSASLEQAMSRPQPLIEKSLTRIDWSLLSRTRAEIEEDRKTIERKRINEILLHMS
jgi:hypothetical protein